MVSTHHSEQRSRRRPGRPPCKPPSRRRRWSREGNLPYRRWRPWSADRGAGECDLLVAVALGTPRSRSETRVLPRPWSKPFRARASFRRRRFSRAPQDQFVVHSKFSINQYFPITFFSNPICRSSGRLPDKVKSVARRTTDGFGFKIKIQSM